MFIERYSNVLKGPDQWQKIKTEKSSIYNWDDNSTYVKKPPSSKIFHLNQKDLKLLKMRDLC